MKQDDLQKYMDVNLMREHKEKKKSISENLKVIGPELEKYQDEQVVVEC